MPLFLYDKKTQEVIVVIAIAKRPHKNTISSGNAMFMDGMNVTPLSISPRDVSGFINPIVEKAFADSGLSDEEITEKMLQFSSGDFSALDGFVVNTNITTHKVYR